jgi:hypothetical protein
MPYEDGGVARELRRRVRFKHSMDKNYEGVFLWKSIQLSDEPRRDAGACKNIAREGESVSFGTDGCGDCIRLFLLAQVSESAALQARRTYRKMLAVPCCWLTYATLSVLIGSRPVITATLWRSEFASCGFKFLQTNCWAECAETYSLNTLNGH